MRISKDEALKLLEIVLTVGDWSDPWLGGVEDLAEIFPEHPWWEYVAALAEAETNAGHCWQSVLDKKTFYEAAGVM